MNRYNSKTAKWQQQNKEEQKMNKTEFIKVRCTLEEKQRIKSKAESAGRKFSDYDTPKWRGGSRSQDDRK